MDLNDIYTQVIAENSKSKRNRHEVESPSVVLEGVNPSCGDDITLSVRLSDDGIIEDAGFTGVGCAISQSSASIMIDLVKGKTMEEAKELTDTFLGMIKREVTDEDELEKLDEAIAFQNIANMPARVKCAVLSWHTLEDAMEEYQSSKEE